MSNVPGHDIFNIVFIIQGINHALNNCPNKQKVPMFSHRDLI